MMGLRLEPPLPHILSTRANRPTLLAEHCLVRNLATRRSPRRSSEIGLRPARNPPFVSVLLPSWNKGLSADGFRGEWNLAHVPWAIDQFSQIVGAPADRKS